MARELGPLTPVVIEIGAAVNGAAYMSMSLFECATKSVCTSFFTVKVVPQTAPAVEQVVGSLYEAVTVSVAPRPFTPAGVSAKVFGSVVVGAVMVKPLPATSATEKAGEPAPTITLPSASIASAAKFCAPRP